MKSRLLKAYEEGFKAPAFAEPFRSGGSRGEYVDQLVIRTWCPVMNWAGTREARAQDLQKVIIGYL